MGVKVGDRVRVVANETGHGFGIGEVVTVLQITKEIGTEIKADNGSDYWFLHSDEYEKVEDELDLIANLSAEVARLKYRVDMLEIERVSADQSFKIADELSHTRKEVVKQAQADIEELKTEYGGERYRFEIQDEEWAGCGAEFVSNREKRTVVAILRGWCTGEIYARGIAKCMPDDVFNSHLGKAIALRRALGEDVPKEYTNAPAPEGVEVGDVVQCDNFRDIRRVYAVNRIENTVAFEGIGWDFIQSVRVIDDSDREEYRSNDRQGRR